MLNIFKTELTYLFFLNRLYFTFATFLWITSLSTYPTQYMNLKLPLLIMSLLPAKSHGQKSLMGYRKILTVLSESNWACTNLSVILFTYSQCLLTGFLTLLIPTSFSQPPMSMFRSYSLLLQIIVSLNLSAFITFPFNPLSILKLKCS